MQSMRLLIEVGDSPGSKDAVKLGARVAEVLRKKPSTTTTVTVIAVVQQEDGRPQAEKALANAREILEPVAPDARAVIRTGNPYKEILREVVEGNYNLIIVAEESTHHLLSQYFRPTAAKLAQRAPCSVLVVKGSIRPIRRVLMCDSGAQGPSMLSRFIGQVAQIVESDVEVTVLHVMSQISAGPGVVGKQLKADTEELIKEHSPEGRLLEVDVQMLERLHSHPHPKIRHGFVVDEILKEAKAGDYDLVIIGAYRGEGWRLLLLDNLAVQIISRIDRPVLVVR